ncbi:hypothetical protein [Salinibacter ruber]|uniref:hypothetical protein n=1 Tax=Salinibacter ruber TaxID=146919 RepID=UPI0021698DBD|nr:hypothetical protein [Salinibacter ruber]MCS4051027.1 hypothetical protein [Salinibacter ruber]MCS4150088.1 hypothetical protein [Salinibacter ruber]
MFLPPGDETTTEQLRAEVHEVLGAPPAWAQVHPLTPAEVDRLAALARRRGPGLFVMPGTGSPLVDASLQRFLYELDRPLLLVR